MGCMCGTGSRRGARSTALVLTVINILFLSIQVILMFISAMACEARRRPYIWMSRGFGCILRGLNVGFLIVWIAAVGQDSLRHMVFSSTAIAMHVVGMCVYSVICTIHNSVQQETYADYVQAIFLHMEELPSRIPPWLMLIPAGIEALFLRCLFGYQQDFELRSDAKAATDSDVSAGDATGQSGTAGLTK